MRKRTRGRELALQLLYMVDARGDEALLGVDDFLKDEAPDETEAHEFARQLLSGTLDNQEEIEGIVADWAKQHDAAEIDRVLNEAGVICGPIYTIADIFEDPQFKARDMLLEHVDPEFGPYIGPGIVPKLSRTPGSVRWSATWERGSHNAEVYGGLLGLSDEELAELREEGVI